MLTGTLIVSFLKLDLAKKRMSGKSELFLVYPQGIYDNYYLPFYDDFIRNFLIKYLVNTNINLVIGCGFSASVPYEKFGRSNCNVIRLLINHGMLNIWIKDWAPITTGCDESQAYVKTIYHPGYLSCKERKNDVWADYTGRQLAKGYCRNAKYSGLIMDGGSFVHNGKDTGIISNRVISDNETLSIDEIREIFRNEFNIKNLVILPVEPGDVTGHVDGLVRFVGENTLIVADYPSGYMEGKEFCDKIKLYIRKLLPDVNIISLINEIPKDLGKKATIPSATGNHVNFLAVENKIFMPDYGLESDDKAYEALLANLRNYEIIRVKSAHLKRISKDGGVLNCITWQMKGEK